MPVRGIDHVQLAMPVGGEADALAFYGGLLGITPVPKPPHLAVRGGCWFETEAVPFGNRIELMEPVTPS